VTERFEVDRERAAGAIAAVRAAGRVTIGRSRGAHDRRGLRPARAAARLAATADDAVTVAREIGFPVVRRSPRRTFCQDRYQRGQGRLATPDDVRDAF
jgi:hypothetical protein